MGERGGRSPEHDPDVMGRPVIDEADLSVGRGQGLPGQAPDECGWLPATLPAHLTTGERSLGMAGIKAVRPNER